jgi:hypothetical protein
MQLKRRLTAAGIYSWRFRTTSWAAGCSLRTAAEEYVTRQAHTIDASLLVATFA